MATNNQIIASFPSIAIANADGAVQSLQLFGNVAAGDILTDNLLYANGQPWVFANGGQVPTLQQILTSGNTANIGITLTGNANVTADYFYGNGHFLTGVNTSGGGNVIPYINFQVNVTANNQTFTSNLLTQYANANSLSLFKDGVYVEPTSYTLANSNITVNTKLYANTNLDIIPQGGGSSSSGSNYGNIDVANYLPVYSGPVAATTIYANTQSVTNAFQISTQYTNIGNAGGSIVNIINTGNGANLTFSASGQISQSSGNIAILANANITGNVTARGYIGDGAVLANVAHTSFTSNATIAVGDIFMASSGSTYAQTVTPGTIITQGTQATLQIAASGSSGGNQLVPAGTYKHLGAVGAATSQALYIRIS